jgi:hypothetical protein
VNNYRLYRLDGAGGINSAEWLEAADDEPASRRAAELCVDGGVVELWARDRLVVRLGSAANETLAARIDLGNRADGSQSAT